jgi:GDP-L-galactose phosphorylase
MINVSPIEYGHVLLVPRALERLPQQLDAEGLAVGQALALAREVGSSDFRVGYNSLGAFATINHLHFQVGLCERNQ